MSPCTLSLLSLPKGDAQRVHPFEDQENSMGALESAARLSNPSAQWLTASLDIVLSAYSNIQSLANSNSKWVNDALEDVVKLLDMCNAVSNNIAEVKRYERLLQSAVHSLDHAGMDISKISQTPLLRVTNLLADCRRACTINVVARCNTATSRWRRLVNIEEVIASSDYSRISRPERDLSKDMCNLKDCTSSVLETVAQALSVELPRPFLHAQRDPRVAAGFCSGLRRLYERVRIRNSRSKGSRCLLHEIQTADVLVRKLHDILSAEKQEKAKKEQAEVKRLVEALKKCMVELDGGIAALDSKIKELYSALIGTRMALLDILTYSL